MSRWIKNDSSVLGSVDEIETVKEGPIHIVSSFKKISELTRFSFKPLEVFSRPKTRPVKKLWMNMKALLNSRFNKMQVISVQDTSSDDEENKKSKELESAMYQVFININQRLRQIPDLTPKICIYNSSDMEEDNPSLFTKAEIGETS